MSDNTQLLDKMSITEDLLVNCRHIRNSNHRTNIIGHVEVIRRSVVDGEEIFTRSTHSNDLLINGAVYFSEKANNLRSIFNPVSLDIELGSNTTTTRDSETIKQEFICGIIVGTDGCTNTYNTVKPVKKQSRKVPGMIPYRRVPITEDLKNAERDRYFLRSINPDNTVSYYGKRFEIEPVIKVLYEDGTEVPNTIDLIADPKLVKVYAEYKLTVDQKDIREFFKITEGSTVNSKINSAGLVAGYKVTKDDGTIEFANVRCLTTMNMENQELKDSESTITFYYRVLIM